MIYLPRNRLTNKELANILYPFGNLSAWNCSALAWRGEGEAESSREWARTWKVRERKRGSVGALESQTVGATEWR